MYSWSRITVVQRRPQKPLNATSQHLNFTKFPGGTCPQTPLELGRVAASCLLLWSGPGITDILATPLYHNNALGTGPAVIGASCIIGRR